MNSLTPWMKAGTPDVVTVMEGAPPGPAPAAPVTPSREPRSWLRSGGISWGWASAGVVSGWLCGLAVLAVDGGVGPEVEKEKEEDEEEVWDEEENEEEEDVDVDEEEDEEDEGVWPAVEKTDLMLLMEIELTVFLEKKKQCMDTYRSNRSQTSLMTQKECMVVFYLWTPPAACIFSFLFICCVQDVSGLKPCNHSVQL